MSLQLTILGSGGAIPAYGRFTSSQYLVIGKHHFLIDCGEGAQIQLGKANLGANKINHIFISHLHGDHYLGLMGLLFSMHLNHRGGELHLYSFRGLDEIILAQLKYAQSALNFRLKFHELTADRSATVFEDDEVTVTTIPLQHKIKCCGFLFREKTKPRRIDKEKMISGMLLQHIARLKSGQDVIREDGTVLYRNEDFTLPPRHSFSYAYCSDTAYSPHLVEQIRHVDLLYHEATFMEEERQKAVDTYHSTARDAAQIAMKANVGKLLLGHFSARYRELDGLLLEAQAVFPNTELALECHTFEPAHERVH